MSKTKLGTFRHGLKMWRYLFQCDQGSTVIHLLAAQVQDLLASAAKYASETCAPPEEKYAVKERNSQAAQDVFTPATLFSFTRVAQSLIINSHGISSLQSAL